MLLSRERARPEGPVLIWHTEVPIILITEVVKFICRDFKRKTASGGKDLGPCIETLMQQKRRLQNS